MRYFDEKHETMSRDEMTALQSARLVDAVKRMYEGAPYYRAKMDAIGLEPGDIKGIEDIDKLPFTTKADLRANYPFGCFALPKSEIARVHASSGTTGKLTVVGLTNRDIDDWAECAARALVMAGCDKNDIVHVSYGYGLFTGGLGLHYGSEKLGSMTVPASAGNTMRQITLLKDFGATTLACTPSYAMVIGEEIEKAGMDISEFKLKRGIFGAEPWVSMSCGEGWGLHVMEDFFYPEIVDPATLKPVPDKTDGELVFTTLRKQGMPLIRYRTRDISALNHDKCDCGRTLCRMKRVSGRTDDMLIIRGVNVFPSQIESVLMNIKEIIGSHYQIIVDRQKNLDTMEIQVELAPSVFSDEVRKVEEVRRRIEHDMMGNLGVGAKITLVSPDSLPLSTGKTVRIIDKRSI